MSGADLHVRTASSNPTVDRPNRDGDVVGTVAAHASWNVPVGYAGQRAGAVLAALQGHPYDTVALVLSIVIYFLAATALVG